MFFVVAWAWVAGAGQWEPSSEKALALYQKAVEALNDGDAAGAEALLRQADRAQPGVGVIRHGLATALLLQDRTGPAVEELTRLAELFPDEADVWRQLSQARYLRQEFGQASDAAGRAVALAPASVQALMAARTVWLRTGEYPRLLEATRAARALDDRGEWDCIEASVLVEQERTAEARTLLPACREASTRPLVSELETKLGLRDGSVTPLEAAQVGGSGAATAIARAQEAIRAGEPAAAIAQLDPVLGAEPHNGHARVLRGVARYLADDDAGARQDLQAAFGAETWIDQKDGSFTGITTKKAEDEYRQTVREGAVILVITDLAAKDVGAAARHLEAARADLGPAAVFDAAAAAIRLAEGDEGAWTAFESARKKVDNAVFRTVAQEMLRTDAAGAPAPVIAWLGAKGNHQPVYNKAATLSNDEDHAGCLALVEGAIGGFDGDGERMLAELGYRCAVLAGDFPRADGFLARAGGPAAQPGWLVVNHAVGLLEAEKGAAALALVDAVVPDDKTKRSHYAARTEALLALGQVDRAFALADGTDAWSDMRLAAAVYNAGNVIGAQTLLARACPRLPTGTSERASCDDLAKQVVD